MITKDYGNDVLYEHPTMTIGRLFRKVFKGEEVFPEGMLDNEKQEGKKDNSIKIEVYEVEQNGL